MSLQALVTALLLPPILLVLACLLGGLLRRRLLVVVPAMLLLALATPLLSGWLLASLEMAVPRGPFAAPPGCDAGPGAIVILSADVARGQDGPDVGALTLERLRAGAALQRRTGLPVLVSGGPIEAGGPPLAQLMRRSLVAEFDVPVRWLELRSGDTAQNAAFSVPILRAEGICAAFVVTHAWHLPRALEAFARHPGVAALPAPVRLRRPPTGDRFSDYVPRADRWTESWFALREWAGRLVYALRD